MKYLEICKRCNANCRERLDDVFDDIGDTKHMVTIMVETIWFPKNVFEKASNKNVTNRLSKTMVPMIYSRRIVIKIKWSEL